ncbi:MAG: hypothetical protein ACI4IS_00325 [Acutalibacteraceae bacterium]
MINNLSKVAHYIVLREQGMTYQAIADIYGVTKQSVEELIKKAELQIGNNERIRKNNANIEKIAYKGVYDLFANDTSMTVSKLTRICNGTSNKSSVSKFQRFIEGGESVTITINQIKNLIKFSGMSFEQLFEPRESEVSE